MTSHAEFQGRASWGVNFIEGSPDADEYVLPNTHNLPSRRLALLCRSEAQTSLVKTNESLTFPPEMVTELTALAQ